MAKYESLDIWRGAACVSVVMFHSTRDAYPDYDWATGDLHSLVLSLLQRGWIGVPMFFVISGYCIAASARAASKRGKSARTFFIRRFRRIYPPLWAALAATAVLVCILPNVLSAGTEAIPRPSKLTLGQWLGNLSLTETWRSHCVGGRRGFLLQVAWTLCFEEQFYLLVGLTLWLMPKRLFAGVALITLFTLIMRHVAQRTLINIDGFFFDGQWLLFAAGVLVYYSINEFPSRRRHAMAVLFAACCLSVSFPFDLFGFDSHHSTGHFNRGSVLYGYGFALILLFLHPYDARIVGSAYLKPLKFCGMICYSLYLVHWPVSKAITRTLYETGFVGGFTSLVATVAACCLASVSVGWLFHCVVERRFLNTPLDFGNTVRRGATLQREQAAIVPVAAE